MEEENKETKQELIAKVNCEIEKLIDEVVSDGIGTENLDYLYRLVDIHKDLANEKYWKEKENFMMYRDYGNYEDSYGRRGVKGTGPYSRYRDEGSYGHRGVSGTGRGRYRGYDIMDEMSEHYGNYSEGKEMYGADTQTMESFKYMVKSFKDYYKHLKENASSNEEVQILDQAIDEMARM